MNGICDVCERAGQVDLVSSGCAPVTYLACPDCHQRGAESLEVAATWYLLEGGSEAAEQHLSRIVTWKDCDYAGGDAVRAYCDANRDQIMSELNSSYELIDLPIDAKDEAIVSTQKFSDRVLRALGVIERGQLSRKGLQNFYANANRDPDLTEAEREAVISALEARIRFTSPRDAKVLFGPKDAEARAILGRINESLAQEFDLSGNTVGSGVKTGGDMISGNVYVSVYISYKGADRRHATLGVFQCSAESTPLFVVRLYQTGRNVSELELREEFPIDEVDEAAALYRAHLMRVLGVEDA